MVESWNFKFNFGILQTWGCGGQAMSFRQKMIVETQMPITPEHAFKEKSTKLLTLLSLRTIYNRTFQCETPCMTIRQFRFRICKNMWWTWYLPITIVIKLVITCISQMYSKSGTTRIKYLHSGVSPNFWFFKRIPIRYQVVADTLTCTRQH